MQEGSASANDLSNACINHQVQAAGLTGLNRYIKRLPFRITTICRQDDRIEAERADVDEVTAWDEGRLETPVRFGHCCGYRLVRGINESEVGPNRRNCLTTQRTSGPPHNGSHNDPVVVRACGRAAGASENRNAYDNEVSHGT